MATIQRHDTLAYNYNENTSTGNLAQERQAELQYFGTKAAKRKASTSIWHKATNQELVLITICIHTNKLTITGSSLALILLSSNENLGIKYVSCVLDR
jgi:hypothetical protein